MCKEQPIFTRGNSAQCKPEGKGPRGRLKKESAPTSLPPHFDFPLTFSSARCEAYPNQILAERDASRCRKGNRGIRLTNEWHRSTFTIRDTYEPEIQGRKRRDGYAVRSAYSSEGGRGRPRPLRKRMRGTRGIGSPIPSLRYQSGRRSLGLQSTDHGVGGTMYV